MNSAHELSTLIDALRTLRRDTTPRAALATLTRTRGSTFRRPGTRMLVLGDGRVVCELSGGCPQRDIVTQAQDVIASNLPRLIRYNADSGLDVLLEMGCGGELEVLIEPLTTARTVDFVDTVAQCLDERRCACLATLFAIDGMVVMPQRMLWRDHDVLYNDINDPALTRSIVDAIAPATGKRTIMLRLPSARGVVDVLVEPISPPHALVVIGSSAAARALLPLARALGWQTTLVDHDQARLQATPLPSGLHAVCATPGSLRDVLPLDAQSSVVVMTHNLEQDIAYLGALRGAPVAYLGALGSRDRVARMRDNPLLADLHVHAPAGLDIGSETPEEIALAIAAEIMAVINNRGGSPLHDNEGAIHG
jgi:xanthine dehydrogenase accessory factor